MINDYNSNNIKVLKGLEAVKKRPGMYIGNTDDGTGLHHMIFEIIDNSMDEVLSEYCSNIYIKIYNDNSISIEDDGRGIPVEIHKEENISTAELIMTVLHSGGKFNNDTYKISGGLHGVGLSVVNALSKKLILLIYRNGYVYEQTYKYGIPINKISVINKTNKTGTYIKFWPDDENIFKTNNKIKYNIVFNKINELSYLNNKVIIHIEDENNLNNNKILYNNGNIKNYLKYLIKDNLKHNIFYFENKDNDFYLEVALYWSDKEKTNIICFTNNIKQLNGGTHLSSLKYSVTKTINTYINNNISNYKKNSKKKILGEDIREGLIGIISIKFPNPKFSSQTKDKLISSEIKSFIDTNINRFLLEYLSKNDNDSKYIINKIINCYKIRESIKNTKELIKKNIANNSDNIFNILGKLSNCQERNPLLSEIYIVEGDSAGGSARQGRNKKFQAILPIKGKILNVEKSNFNKLIASEEITSIITSLGCGILNNNFDINKLKYHKVIIMTDADIDGSHIKTLLLTFFYRYMPLLIDMGYIYIAQPPLYKINIYNNKNIYLYSDIELTEIQLSLSKKYFEVYKNNLLIDINEFIDNLIEYIKIIKTFNLLCIYKINIIDSIIKINLFEKNIFNDFYKINSWLNIYKNILDNNSDNIKFEYIINKRINSKESEYEILIKYIISDVENEEFIINKELFKKYNSILYFSNLFEKNIFIKNIISKDIINIYNKNILFLIKILTNNIYNYTNIQRYKGLGEMNPDQLWSTTMDPEKRNIHRVFVKDKNYTNNLISILMGNSIVSRKKFIEKYYNMFKYN